MSYFVDADQLKKFMIDRKIKTVTELSEKSGISRKTLGDVLNCKIRPSTNVMDVLVEVLDIPQAQAGVIFFSKDLRDT